MSNDDWKKHVFSIKIPTMEPNINFIFPKKRNWETSLTVQFSNDSFWKEYCHVYCIYQKRLPTPYTVSHKVCRQNFLATTQYGNNFSDHSVIAKNFKTLPAFFTAYSCRMWTIIFTSYSVIAKKQIANISLEIFKIRFFGSVAKSSTQRGSLSVKTRSRISHASLEKPVNRGNCSWMRSSLLADKI